MRNLKVSVKLMVGFIIVTIFSAIIGVTGLIGLSIMSGEADIMYNDMAVPLGDLSLATEYFQRIRVQMRNAAIYSGDTEQLQAVAADLTDRMRYFEEEIAAYEASINTTQGRQMYDQIQDQYSRIMKPGSLASLESAKQGLPTLQIIDEMAATTAAADTIANDLRELTAVRLQSMSEANAITTQVFRGLMAVIIVVLLISIIVSLLLAVYISGLISKPLSPLYEFMKQAGSTGDIVLSQDVAQAFDRYSHQQDEIGQTIDAAVSFVNRIGEVSRVLETIAGGDLTVDIEPLTNKDRLGLSLHKMDESLNTIFGEINLSTNQVSIGAGQVADGAQALATGATQQAASVQELSSSVTEVAERTKENAARAENAAELANTIKDSAEKGHSQMEEMMHAVREINQASLDIGKVIKVIDDIAFQTNILALNAAVEAARAGQQGKGFAVVADEVRNLAAKSAEAAKGTESLITASIEKAQFGVDIAVETSTSLNEIVKGINESNTLVAEIASSSEEQSIAISQINTGIDQVAKVVQQNSATAEESAAASEEMSSQSAMLKQLVAQFKVKPGSNTLGGFGSPSSASKRQPPAGKRYAELQYAESAVGYDKY